MAKKHTYKIGDIVKFKFFDGQTYVGKITELTYMGVTTGNPNYQLPQYRLEVCESKRTTYYTISDTYFKEVNGDLKIEHAPVTRMSGPVTTKTKHCHYSGLPSPTAYQSHKSELDMAIERQKDFIRGNVTV